jgi:hypothetical protein
MKKLITVAAAGLLMASVAVAGAQNAPTNPPNSSPNDINKSNLPNNKSGTESQATAHKPDKNAAKNMQEKEKNTTSGSTPTSK